MIKKYNIVFDVGKKHAKIVLLEKNSKILQDTTIALPCYKGLDIKKVIEKINLFIKNKY